MVLDFRDFVDLVTIENQKTISQYRYVISGNALTLYIPEAYRLKDSSVAISFKNESYSLTNAKTLRAIITILVALSLYEMAEDFLSKVKKNFDTQLLNMQLARVYFHKGMLEQAENVLPRRLNNYEKFYMLGRIKEQRGLIKEAIVAYEKSLQYKISYEVYGRIGVLAYKGNQKAKALQNLVLARKLNPKDKESVKNIGIYYYNEANYEKASVYFALCRDNVFAEKFKGISLLLAGNREKAGRVLRGIIKSQPDNDVISILEYMKNTKEKDPAAFFKVFPALSLTGQ